ncbi:glutaredoxin-C1-like [Tasmannia lanceolata]|uniref:glutaredoxin-C1-like n=1 Tax=Tasmannia lanceolata TaxID=3420 RepID=UPI004062BC3E
MDRVLKLAEQNSVVIFSMSSCCMCHTIKRLFYEMGANPAIYELDKVTRGNEMAGALTNLMGRSPPVPVVYIGNQLIGSNKEVFSRQMDGTLIKLLLDAGAIAVSPYPGVK